MKWFIVLRGSADDIVKIWKRRVDPVSLQNKLKQIPGIRDAVVEEIPVTPTGKYNRVRI